MGAISMDSADFVQAVRDRLHPATYPGLLQTKGSPFDLVLVRNRGRMAHDVFGVLALAPGQDPRQLIETARADVSSRFGGLCFRRAIVLHLLVHAPIEMWQDVLGELCADRTGFRGVMVQSVYSVDPVTGASHKSVSRWGALRYSKVASTSAQQVVGTVQSLLPSEAILPD
jgi:hypothetical protein